MLYRHEAVANHFSLAVNEDGTQFLMNPNQVHFSRIRASDLLLLDANDPDTLSLPGAPDPSAWGLHGSVHRRCPHHRCLMHVHSVFATVLASLEDSNMPPIDQNTATFYNRYVIDEEFGGLAFENEGERCASMLGDPKKKVMIMGNHGVLVMGDTVAETFNRLYYFERAAETYIRALQTGAGRSSGAPTSSGSSASPLTHAGRSGVPMPALSSPRTTSTPATAPGRHLAVVSRRVVADHVRINCLPHSCAGLRGVFAAA